MKDKKLLDFFAEQSRRFANKADENLKQANMCGGILVFLVIILFAFCLTCF